MSKKETATSDAVVTEILFLNSNSFYALFDSTTTHSFMSTRSIMRLNLKNMKVEINY